MKNYHNKNSDWNLLENKRVSYYKLFFFFFYKSYIFTVDFYTSVKHTD